MHRIATPLISLALMGVAACAGRPSAPPATPEGADSPTTDSAAPADGAPADPSGRADMRERHSNQGAIGDARPEAVAMGGVAGDPATEIRSFSDAELVELLEELGSTEVELRQPGFIHFQSEGEPMALFRFRDGDLQLYFGLRYLRCTLEPINEWNKQHRHSRAYIDGENDPVIESDLLSDGGLNRVKLRVFLRAFQASVAEYQRFLIGACTPNQSYDV
ncbi:YbjN domain-containing protein [Haliangium ochraceum]|uniref:YbjN domain-containing protein n=1 Tax=Haliangium ochraceum (strain DSM 14365 / JCM 11303 / SMP-2) TaxID=502025 RepID=D0LFU0_HALO1|nr:YbjN domain-containing protein [Haliangium ochraceum]ACY14542.1 hypothetical protein Hoch_1996 [Haliangium ochraceum DSM 14365]